MLSKALLMVFAASGLLPSSNDVLFCTERTPLPILEAFIMRSMLYDIKMKQYKSSVKPINPSDAIRSGGAMQPKVFVIANFHKLNLQMQNDVYEFIKKQEQ